MGFEKMPSKKESGPVPQGSENPKNKKEGFHTGVKENPDGSLDYSKALKFTDPATIQKLETSFATSAEANTNEKREKFEREKNSFSSERRELKDGSPEMVLHDLKYQLWITEGMLAETPRNPDGTFDKVKIQRLEERKEKLEEQIKCLSKLAQKIGRIYSETDNQRFKQYLETRDKTFLGEIAPLPEKEHTQKRYEEISTEVEKEINLLEELSQKEPKSTYYPKTIEYLRDLLSKLDAEHLKNQNTVSKS